MATYKRASVLVLSIKHPTEPELLATSDGKPCIRSYSTQLLLRVVT